MKTAQEFIKAVKEGDINLVEQIIACDPSLVNAKSQGSVSAVLIAIYRGKPAIAELLIAEGAELDIFEAAAAGKHDQVKALLDRVLLLLDPGGA